MQVPFLHYCTGFYFSLGCFFGFRDILAFVGCLVFFLGTCFIEHCSLFLDGLSFFLTTFLVLLMGDDSNLLVGYRENGVEFEDSECVFGICMNNGDEAFGNNWGRGILGLKRGFC